MEETNLLQLRDVSVAFKVEGKYYNATDNVNLDVKQDEILAVVGESGCGKSTLATSIIGLHNMNITKISGSIKFLGQQIIGMKNNQMDKIRGKDIAMIFQDPLAALNPLMKVGEQIKDVLDLHTQMTDLEKENRVLELLKQVGILNAERVQRQYPHELSGGMRQRIIIAIAIACKPQLIIADEPTTALDVTIQAQILDLLKDIQKQNHAGIILITHDLGVVAEMADRVAVMYAGQVVELGNTKQIFKNPKHPYTRSLLRSIPQDENTSDDLYVIEGMVPSLKDMKRTGCRFAPRIPWIESKAHEENPVMHEVEDGHQVLCTCYKYFSFQDEEV